MLFRKKQKERIISQMSVWEPPGKIRNGVKPRQLTERKQMEQRF